MHPRAALHFVVLMAAVLVPAAARAAVAEREMRVAVLPFEGIGVRREDACLTVGLTETLTAALVRVQGLRVVERGHLKLVIEELKLQNSGLVKPGTARELGAALGATHLVLGSYQSVADAMRITCRLVDVETGAVDPGHAVTVTRALAGDADLFRLQDELVAAVLKSFGITPTPAQQGQIAQVTQPTTSREAYALYVRARESYLSTTAPAIAEAIRLYDAATRADVGFGLAWAGLAEALCRQSVSLAQDEQPRAGAALLGRALATAEKALALAPGLPESHRAHAAALLAGARSDRARVVQAGAALERALALNPRDAETHFLYWVAQGCPLDGKGADCLRTALEMNPRLVPALTTWGRELKRAGRLAEAADAYGRALDASPRSARAAIGLAETLVARGDRAGAVAALRRYADAVKGDPAYREEAAEVRKRMQAFLKSSSKRR